MNVKFAICTGFHCGSVVFASACSLLEMMEMLRAVFPTWHQLQTLQSQSSQSLCSMFPLHLFILWISLSFRRDGAWFWLILWSKGTNLRKLRCHSSILGWKRSERVTFRLCMSTFACLDAKFDSTEIQTLENHASDCNR